MFSCLARTVDNVVKFHIARIVKELLHHKSAPHQLPFEFIFHLSSTFDDNLPARSQFYSDHRVNFSTPTSCQSATFDRSLFAFVLCFYGRKSSKTTNAVKAYRSAKSIKCSARMMIPTLYSPSTSKMALKQGKSPA